MISETLVHAIEQFRQAILAAGLSPPDTIIDDGKLHRFSTNGKPRDTAGWYVLHSDGVPAGTFGCYRAGLTQGWSSKSTSEMTQAERDAHKQRIKAMQQQREADLAQRNQQAATEAAAIWAAAAPATEHPYSTRKQVKPTGLKTIAAAKARAINNGLSLRLTGTLLVIPLFNGAGELRNLQFIAADGTKRPVTGGAVTGLYHVLGRPTTGELCTAEGWATSASIHAATGLPVVCAFNSGNLLPVALALQSKYPAMRLTVCGDDDYMSDGNPGLTAATEAAKAVGGHLAVPDFGQNRPDGAKDFNDLACISGAEAVKRCIDAAQLVHAGVVKAAGIQWPAPKVIEAEMLAVPAFNADVLLPPVLREFVLDEADRMPCSPDFIAATLMVTLGSVIGSRCAIKPKRRDDWIVAPNLWGGIVALPSFKKTPAMNAVIRFVDRLEAKEAEKLAEDQKVYEAEVAAFEAHQAAVKASMKKAATGRGDDAKMSAAMADMQGLQPPEPPHQRRFKSNDGTVAKLGELLVKNPQGLLIFRDELTGLLASWEKEGNDSDKPFYLESWNGTGSHSVDRIGRGSLLIPNLCLSICGGIQPEKMEAYLRGITQGLGNDGGIQRFQVLVYPDPTPWEWRDRYPVKGAREAMRDLFDRLATFDPVQDGATPSDDFVKLPHFAFDDEAQEIFIEWATDLYRVQIAGESNPMMQQHLAKFEKLFCSIALILHMATGQIGPVKAASALMAAAWCEYLAAHARRIYGLLEVSKVTAAKLLGRRIADGKLAGGFTARDVKRKQWSGLVTTSDVETALAILEENHWVIGIEYEGENGGRPTTRYQINPQILRLKS